MPQRLSRLPLKLVPHSSDKPDTSADAQDHFETLHVYFRHGHNGTLMNFQKLQFKKQSVGLRAYYMVYTISRNKNIFYRENERSISIFLLFNQESLIKISKRLRSWIGVVLECKTYV